MQMDAQIDMELTKCQAPDLDRKIIRYKTDYRVT